MKRFLPLVVCSVLSCAGTQHPSATTCLEQTSGQSTLTTSIEDIAIGVVTLFLQNGDNLVGDFTGLVDKYGAPFGQCMLDKTASIPNANVQAARKRLIESKAQWTRSGSGSN